MDPGARRFGRLTFGFVLLGVLCLPAPQFAAEGEIARAPLVADAPVTIAPGTPAVLDASAVVNFAELARLEELGLVPKPPVRALLREEEANEMEWEPGANAVGPISPDALITPPPFVPFVASPSPTTNFIGLDDIAMVDSSYLVIPPDVAGAVGPAKLMESFNNNYRIRDKSTGATISTVGTATFWAPVVAASERLNLTDPRLAYDAYNNRWIAAMQTVTTGAGKILVGVSQTNDPGGSWYLYSFNSAATVDFPILGFNKNWISISINRYSGAFQKGINLIVNYPLARTGTGSGTIITTLATGSHFCSAPCVTYSSTSDTLFIVTHLSAPSATYTLDWISGTAAAPVYNVGGAIKTRTGGAWVQPNGNILPQSAPNSGTSACGATPCPIEVQDSQIRSAPTYRGGFIYYAQTAGLPSGGLTHTGVQWTKITTAGSPPSGDFVDGGRLEDPTATATNGGKWYACPHIAVNATGDFMVGFSQFSSAQHPAAGYAMHLAADGAGTIRDAFIYKVGDDYYHKTFSSATGRNRWGDFSTAQVDPVDDASLWSLQEYAKTRVGTNDGNTGSNSSRWSSWWAAVAPAAPTVTILSGPSQNEGNSGLIGFNFTVQLSSSYSLPVTVNYQTSDGSATVANNDYQAATSSIVIAPGATSGPITVNVVGDVNCESDETFGVSLTSATNGTIGSPISATGTIVNDETKTITASAGTGGTISPNGSTVLSCGASQSFTITPAACYTIADVLVDGASAGAVTSYTFTNVQTDHTIAASFAATNFTITASAGAGGAISPSGAGPVSCGGSQTFTISPDSCHVIADVLVDGASVGAVPSYSFTNVQASHTIAAAFTLKTYSVTASAGAGGEISPSGSVPVACAGDQTVTITPDSCHAIADVTVDGSSVGAVTTYAFTNVQAPHTISASFSINVFTIAASAGAGGSITPSGSVPVDCGASQLFVIATDSCNQVADVLVDGNSVGAVTSYTIANVQAAHTISASFAIDNFTLVTSVVGGGVVDRLPDQTSYACSSLVQLTATPNSGFAFDEWTGDAGGSANPLIVIMDAAKSIAAVFVDVAPPGGVSVTSPNGGEVWVGGEVHEITWSASDNVGVTGVDLDCSFDDGATYPLVIATGLANTGTYSWSVPDTATSSARVRVTAHDAAANSTADASDQEFTIAMATTGVAENLLGPHDVLGVYPNPASSGGIHVFCRLPSAGSMSIVVYDLEGRVVRRLASGSFAGGSRSLIWDGRAESGLPVSAGTYVVRLVTGDGTRATKRFTMMR